MVRHLGLPAAVIGTIAISSSPAVLIHVAHELGASGPVTTRSMSLVALNNVIAFMAFAAVLPAPRAGRSALSIMIGAPLYQVLGSAALGAAMGWPCTWRRAPPRQPTNTSWHS